MTRCGKYKATRKAVKEKAEKREEKKAEENGRRSEQESAHLHFANQGVAGVAVIKITAGAHE